MLLLLLLLRPMRIILRRRIEHVPFPLTARPDFQYAGQVATPITVIRRTPHGGQPIFKHHHVSFVAELMGAEDMRHAVHLQELLHHLLSERISRPSRTQAKFVSLSVRVTPYQVRHGTFVWDLPEAVDDFDLIDAVDAGAQPAVDTEDLVVDHTAQAEIIKHIGEKVPHVGCAVLPRAFGVEAVGLSDAA